VLAQSATLSAVTPQPPPAASVGAAPTTAALRLALDNLALELRGVHEMTLFHSSGVCTGPLCGWVGSSSVPLERVAGFGAALQAGQVRAGVDLGPS